MDIDGALTNDQAAVTSVTAGDETFEANSTGSSNIEVERTNEVAAIESNKTSVFSTTNDKETPDTNSPPATELACSLVESGKELSPSFYLMEDFPRKTPKTVSSRSTSASKPSKAAEFNVFSEKRSTTLVDKQLAEDRQINRTKLFDDESSLPAAEENQDADAPLPLVSSESVDVVGTKNSMVDSSAHLDVSQAKLTLPLSLSPNVNLTGIEMFLEQEETSPNADYESNVDLAVGQLFQPASSYDANLLDIEMFFHQDESSPKADCSLNVSTVNQLFSEEKKPIEASNACDESKNQSSMAADVVCETFKATRSSKRIASLLRQASARAAKPARVEDSIPKAVTGTRSVKKKKLVKEVVEEVAAEEEKPVEVEAIEEPKLKSKQSRKAVTTTIVSVSKSARTKAKGKVDKHEGNSGQKSTNKSTRKRVIEEGEEEDKEALDVDSKPKAVPKRGRKMALVEDELAESSKKPAPKRTRGGKAANVEEAIDYKPAMLTRSRAAATKESSKTAPKKATRAVESRTKRVKVNSSKENTVVKKTTRGRTRARR